MRVDVVSIFPSLVDGFCAGALLGKAREKGLLDLRTHDPRDHTTDVHRTVDDSPFGGGAGMVLRPEPLLDALDAALAGGAHRPVLLLGPGGPRLDQRIAESLAALPGFTLVCGRYEGVDARVVEHACDGELSIGDYVLAGGEVAACVVLEAVGRLLPGVMGNEASAGEESHGADGLLEFPHYTRPAELPAERGGAVPDVLRSGDHARVARWRRAQALVRTAERRPDLWWRRGGGAALTKDDLRGLAALDPPLDAQALDELARRPVQPPNWSPDAPTH